MALPFRIEKVTAPGVSRASITHCQDWRRLLCQNNNVDIHHERPSPQHTSSLSFNHSPKSICVCSWILPPPRQYSMEEIITGLLSLSNSPSLSHSIVFPYRGVSTACPHMPFPFHTHTECTTPSCKKKCVPILFTNLYACVVPHDLTCGGMAPIF